MSDLGFNIWGVVASVLGTIALVPIIWAAIKSEMPTQNMLQLEADMKITDDMLKEGVNEGLLNPEEFQLLMSTTKLRIEGLRTRIYSATTWKEEYLNWKIGLSAKVKDLFREVYKIRVIIARSSADERKRRATASRNPDGATVQEGAAHNPDNAYPLAQTAPPSTPPSSASLHDKSSASCPIPPLHRVSSTSSDTTLVSPVERTHPTLPQTISARGDPTKSATFHPLHPAAGASHSTDTSAERRRRLRSMRREVLVRFGRALT
ncbi:hypothetical protein C8Q77DRAFT_1141420 [Trametes polyzona]|nr:hypothetical protein C8Q77DRAFT_1141420 [Trametes polyzona]